ncbi:TNF receptor-associated factor 1-like [Ptychodera flava]|uniref:TNF receptor-associated factor 1-like n=1 Tax=Ptychodera flava TaxID=63121 RepID=UPI003969FEBA
MSTSVDERLRLLVGNHSSLQERFYRLDSHSKEMEAQMNNTENRIQEQGQELSATVQKVEQLESQVTEIESQNTRVEQEITAQETDTHRNENKMIKLEQELNQRASESEVIESKQLCRVVQEMCRRLDEKVEKMESECSSEIGTHEQCAADIEEMKKNLQQICSLLGMHGVRLQVVETPSDGTMIWKIEDYTRRKHDAVVGKTLSLNSQPFYTSRCGYKMCARVYLNGDGIGEGTHMSLFIVIMRGEYDDFPGMTWPFSRQIAEPIMSTFEDERLQLLLESHSSLQERCYQLDIRSKEMEAQMNNTENRIQEQGQELSATVQKVEQLESQVTEIESQNTRVEQEITAQETDIHRNENKMIKLEQELNQRASESEVIESKQLCSVVQEMGRRLDEKVEKIESECSSEIGTQEQCAADIEEMKKKLQQICSLLGMYGVGLQVVTPSDDGELIFKIKDYTRKKHDAVVGKTLSLNSQPFYTSRNGYKMCARVYLNGDGIGEGTHMSLFFVVMRGEYDDLPELTWPFSRQVTFTLLAHDAQRHLNISEIVRPDPTSTSFRKPTDDMNVAAGCPLFVSQADVEKPTYVKDDTLFIKVSVSCQVSYL